MRKNRSDFPACFFMRCSCTFTRAGCSLSVFQPVFSCPRILCAVSRMHRIAAPFFAPHYCTLFLHHCGINFFIIAAQFFSLSWHSCAKLIDLQWIPKCGLEGSRKAKFSLSDYQPLTADSDFLVYFILCHTLLISKLHFCLSVRSERGCRMAPKSTFRGVFYARVHL